MSDPTISGDRRIADRPSLVEEPFGPTFVDGIGPPLEQLADDYAGEAWAPDFFALVTEIKRLRQMCGPRLDNPSASSGVLPDIQEGGDGGHTRYREALRLLIPTGAGGFVVIKNSEYEFVKALVDEVRSA